MHSRHEYQSLDETDAQFSTEINSKISWGHIQNLDKFFSNVYYYHQQNGFYVTFIEFILQVVKFFSIIWIISIMIELCFVNFQVVSVNNTVSYQIFTNPIIFKSQHHFTTFFVVVALLLLLIFIFTSLPKLQQFYSMSKFYRDALKINDNEISDKSWSDVLKSLEEYQKEHQFSVHKPQLSILDIYQRILRRNNYLIAMINHDILPNEVNLCGWKFIIVTKYYLDSIKFLLFKFPFACPFGDYWQLRPEYKSLAQKQKLVQNIKQMMLIMSLVQLIISPFCFLYLLITKACTYGHSIRVNPGYFVSREVTPLGRLLISHYNELPHEFNYRVTNAYPIVNKYLDSFVNRIVMSVARLFRFVSGGVIVVGFLVSLFDPGFLLAPHIIGLGVGATFVYSCASKLIISEEDYAGCNRALLIRQMLAFIHYIPDRWRLDGFANNVSVPDSVGRKTAGNPSEKAHTRRVYDEVAVRFAARLVVIARELLSVFWTPLVLARSLVNIGGGSSSRASDVDRLVDFLRNYTTEVVGVGDICSFAQMDLAKCSSGPLWSLDGLMQQDMASATGDSKPQHIHHHPNSRQDTSGRCEMSLLNFHCNHPHLMSHEGASGTNPPGNRQSKRDLHQTTIITPTSSANTKFIQGIASLAAQSLYIPPSPPHPQSGLAPPPNTDNAAYANYWANHSSLLQNSTSNYYPHWDSSMIHPNASLATPCHPLLLCNSIMQQHTPLSIYNNNTNTSISTSQLLINTSIYTLHNIHQRLLLNSINNSPIQESNSSTASSFTSSALSSSRI